MTGDNITNAIKVTKDQVLEASKGMLQKQFYMVHSTPTNGLGPVMQNLAVHLDHQCEMERTGVMLAAGPHWTEDESEWLGEGTFVIRAQSLAHAKEIAAKDPMHQAGARSFQVRPWLINEGGLMLHVTFSNGRFTVELHFGSRPMLYLRMCFDKQDGGDLRREIIQSHRQYIASHLADDKAVKVVQGGPMCVGDDTTHNLGSFLVVEAESLTDAQQFHDDDPFTRAGLFEQAHVVRWDRHIGNPGQDQYVA